MRSLGLLLVATLATATVFAQDAAPQALEAGVAVSGTIGPDPDEVRTFTVTVPAECVALRLELGSPDTELELWGMPPGYDELYGDEWQGDESPYIEPKTDMSPWVVIVDRFSFPALETGEYTFDVHLPLDTSPGDTAAFEIVCALFEHPDPTPLPIREVVAGSLRQESGCFQGYQIEVPKGTKSLRIDLFESDDDLVLLARRNRPPTRLNGAIAEVNNSRGRKILHLDNTTRPKLRPGTWHLDVVDPANADRTVTYKLHASFDELPPAELLVIPPLPARHAPGPLGSSLAAVVELSLEGGGGSGTFLDAHGRILTNAHVVSLPDATPTKEPICVAVTLDPRRPPVELFNARVVEFDLARDLALLELVEGYYHQPLPLGLKLPFAPLAPAGSAEITEPLWVVGYPWTGGYGQRVSLSVTAGVVTGYDRVEAGFVLKTDAEISGGNSGGAAFDAQGRHLGVPTATIGADGDKIGYLHPVELIPPSWLER